MAFEAISGRYYIRRTNSLDMEQPLYTFQPNTTEDALSLGIALVIALAGAAGLYFISRKKVEHDQRTRHHLLQMLVFFATIIAAGTALFSFLSMRKTGEVVLYPTHLVTPYGEVAFTDIRKAEIIDNKTPSMIDPNRSRRVVRMLVIEEVSGKAHVMSEKNYDINAIMGRLKEAVEKASK